jgi:hypothetical protein
MGQCSSLAGLIYWKHAQVKLPWLISADEFIVIFGVRVNQGQIVSRSAFQPESYKLYSRYSGLGKPSL